MSPYPLARSCGESIIVYGHRWGVGRPFGPKPFGGSTWQRLHRVRWAKLRLPHRSHFLSTRGHTHARAMAHAHATHGHVSTRWGYDGGHESRAHFCPVAVGARVRGGRAPCAGGGLRACAAARMRGVAAIARAVWLGHSAGARACACKHAPIPESCIHIGHVWRPSSPVRRHAPPPPPPPMPPPMCPPPMPPPMPLPMWPPPLH